MRDLIVFGIVVLSLPFAFRRPFIGLLVFSWLAYMRPQDLCWGFARYMRLSFYVGLTMVAGWVAYEAGRRPFTRWDLRTAGMTLLLVMTFISTIPGEEFGEPEITAGLSEFTKIIVVALFTVGQTDSRQRLRMLIWTFALCLGFFGFKGGLFGLMTGGSAITRGPGGMMEDNNDFALALVMGVPMIWYLSRIETSRLVRKFLLVTGLLTMVTIILTHSRGGFLALCVALLVMAWRSGKLIQASLTMFVGAVLFLNFAPESVLQRLGTIEDAAQGQEDSSVGARFRAWNIAFRMIEHNPVLGVGHKHFRHHYQRHADALYPGEEYFNHVAHNSYLQIWAENGTLAFFVFLVTLLSVFFVSWRLRRLARAGPHMSWVMPYANMLEATTAAFMVGAFFLNRGHFDLSYHWIAVASATLLIARHELAKDAVPESSAERAPETRRAAREGWTPRLAGGGRMPVWARAR
jgi:probable O-glycosylation ligase (exosortase A-associated)